MQRARLTASTANLLPPYQAYRALLTHLACYCSLLALLTSHTEYTCARKRSECDADEIGTSTVVTKPGHGQPEQPNGTGGAQGGREAGKKAMALARQRKKGRWEKRNIGGNKN